VVAQKSRVLKRISKKDSALVRHLAWLRELQENKTRLNEERRIEEEQKLERQRLLKENQRNNTKKLALLASERSLLKEQSDKVDASRKLDRPGWCQTDDAQSEAKIRAQANNENGLLEFIEQLNFDQYNEDLELQTLIGQVKDRIKYLEMDKRKDERLLQSCTYVSKVLLPCWLFLFAAYLNVHLNQSRVKRLQLKSLQAQ
jgi:hypothetical protein